MQHYRDDFERFAHDIINVVQGNSRSGSAAQWQIDKVADMLRSGPCVTIWPRDAKEAAQQARERFLKRPVVPKVLLPPPMVLKPLVPPLVLPPAKKP